MMRSIFSAAYDDIITSSIFASIYVQLTLPLAFEQEEDAPCGAKQIKRRRCTIKSLLDKYGHSNFERAYRMSYDSFQSLHSILENSLLKSTNKTGGLAPIASEIRLTAALQYFAVGSVWDIMISHALSRTETYNSVWAVVDLVNTLLPAL
mmetsp:Transcript_29698/g.45540  ORF Transcript_29698/g.45540 Transcript_29698/m.45540 type:complete len:150 (+) Transcript_29698:60-509(+)